MYLNKYLHIYYLHRLVDMECDLNTMVLNGLNMKPITEFYFGLIFRLRIQLYNYSIIKGQ